MDFLSYCPILVDVLQYVDFTDIPNCKLVNRGTYNVIQKNSLSMPRQDKCLWITCYGDPWYVAVIGIDHPRSVFITDERTFVLQKTSSTLEFYKKTGIPFISTSGPTSDQIVEKIRAKENIREKGPVRYASYRNSSVEDGLRTLLSFLFRRYYYGQISLFNFPDELQPMFADEFRLGRSRCRTLCVLKTSVTNQLVRALGCGTLQLGAGDNRKMASVITEISKLNRPILLQHPVSTDHAKKLHTILQLLMSGEISLQKVELKIKCLYLMRPTVKDYSINIDPTNETTQIVQQIIADGKENWDTINEEWKNKNFNKDITAKRSCDSTVFRLKVSHLGNDRLHIGIKQL